MPFLIVSAALSVLMPELRKPGDINVYLEAAERIVRGEQFYRPDDPPAFTYPPLFVLPFVLLLPLPASARLHLWWFFNLLLFGLIVWQVARQVCREARRHASRGGPPGWVHALLVAVLAARFLISPLEHQSHDLIVLLLVLLAGIAWSAEREIWAGIWGGLATACKATPLLLLPVLVWQRRFRAAACFGAVLVLSTLLPDLLFPNPTGQLWVVCWHERFAGRAGVGRAASAEGAWTSWNALNQSLPGTLHRLSTSPASTHDVRDVALWQLAGRPLQALTVSLEAAVVLVLAWAAWPKRLESVAQDERSFLVLGQLGMVLCAMLLLSPMSSTQHFCALLVPIAFLVTDWLYRRRDPLVGMALGAIFLLGTLGAQDLPGAGLADRMQAWGMTTLCTVVCLAATVRVLWLRSRHLRPLDARRECLRAA